MIEVRKVVTKSGRAANLASPALVRGNVQDYHHNKQTGDFGMWLADEANGHTYQIKLSPGDLWQLLVLATQWPDKPATDEARLEFLNNVRLVLGVPSSDPDPAPSAEPDGGVR